MGEWVSPTSLCDVLRYRARTTPDQIAYRFLPDGTSTSARTWTYRELWRQSQAVATLLEPGEPVVLALPPGLPYVAALFGILWAGAVAVPAYPSTNRRAADRLHAIIADCDPGLIIAEAAKAGRLTRFAPDSRVRWLLLDGDLPVPECEPPRRVADPALLQYTSGSTGDPKGVVLTQQNLISNCRVLAAHLGAEPDRVGLSWLPPYHDMGLIGTILHAVHGGWPLVMMSPDHFVQHPYRWLRAVTDYQVTITVTPTFGLDLCTESVTDDELATVDLSSLRQVFCGSEPVLPGAVAAFADRFAPRGYRPESLIPCYGLAEATLFVTGKPVGAPVTSHDGVISCGPVAAGHELRVVRPDSRHPALDGEVGEIWVHGPNVAAGYYRRSEQTERKFRARLADIGESPVYLRTGDLGYLHDGQLHVTGRLSDLIIIAGRNLHPHDVELTVNRTHELIRRSVAFGVPGESGEELVVVSELRTLSTQTPDTALLRERAVAAVAAEHGVRPREVRFVRVGGVPTTNSGKIRRHTAREHYLAGAGDAPHS
ncbi:fatty acyl-AMP ligase [Saccharopolyspora hattusasensis]|uniref:fatty acyl-AMP ligase n=1 Tax=Saccharopolyspora hattusasensis TaxID=1128679 RepID=UPI003D95DC21